MSNGKLSSDFLHALFVLKSLLGTQFSKSAKTDTHSLSMAEYVLLKQLTETASLTEIRKYLSMSKAAVSQMLSSSNRVLDSRRTDDFTREGQGSRCPLYENCHRNGRSGHAGIYPIDYKNE